MSTLLERQRSFQAYLLGEAPAPPDRIAGTGDACAETRLRVYADAVRLRFLEVLGEDYPGLGAMLGDVEFERLARAYTNAHPSRHRSIRWFGRHMPAFVRGTPPWCEQPVIAEMAAFEWAKGEVVDAADSSVVRVEDIAAIAANRWAEMRPRPVPALRRLELGWNVPALWSALDAGETPPPATRLEHTLDWLVWREGVRIRWRSIDSHEAWALDACGDGEDFDFICNGLAERVGDDAAFRAATYLKQWASDALLAGV